MEEYVCESKVLTTAFYQQTPGPSGSGAAFPLSGVESVGRSLSEADIALASGR
jgi:hypothetical protein